MALEPGATSSTILDTAPLVDQMRMPFLESLIVEKAKQKTSFHMPGHKGTCPPHPQLLELLGGDPHPADLVELNYNIDYLHSPKGALIDAQQLAAAAYGADHTLFLINGSTVGNIAAIMSVIAPGQKIIMSRASHRSVYSGLVLSGAIPVYIESDYHPDVDFPLAVSVEAVKVLLEKHPDAVAVHITSPNYYGVLSNTEAICQLAHAHSMALLVDEAHGSHLRFHPDLPTSAVTLRADIVIHSTHKTQGALTQAAMLHVNDNGFVNHAYVAQVLGLLQSSSPSSILLASLDAARMQMATEGRERLAKLIVRAKKVRDSIRQMDGLWCYGDELIGVSDIFAFDPTKLIIRVSDTGYTGFEAFNILQQQYGIDAEFADIKNIICSMTIADTEANIDKLRSALYGLSTKKRDIISTNIVLMNRPNGLPHLEISPRDAFFAVKSHTVSLDQAVGQIIIENVIPYPPGIPLLVSGEIVEQRHVDYIRYLIGKGHDFIGTDDPSLCTVRVVRK
jgi:lysine decarboxylase